MDSSKVFADERKQMIVELLNREMKKSVAELSDIFSVSATTVRNDLRELETEGLLKRTHGGAMSNKKMVYEPTPVEKKEENIDRKVSIAREAAKLVRDYDVIVLDTGSTTYELAKMLVSVKHLTVITSDFKIAAVLEEQTDAIVIFLGGQLRRNFHCGFGPITVSALKDLNADRVFLGANGISSHKGISTPNLELATVKKEMIRISDEKIVLCDSSKFERTSFAKFAELDEVDLVITDNGLNEECFDKYTTMGIEVIVSQDEQLMAV